MKKHFQTIILLFSILLLAGCSSEDSLFEKLGDPTIAVDQSNLEFGNELTSLSFNLGNVSTEGTLKWTIENLPQWLTISQKKGTLNTYETSSVIVTCDKTGLEPKKYEGVITIKSNDKLHPSLQINVSMEVKRMGNAENVLALEGIVVDSYYSKINNELYILTQNPNTLTILKSNKLTNIKLPKAPNCIAVSENEQTAYIGYSGLMTQVNLKTKQIATQLDLDVNVYDIVYGENNWCYLTIRTSGSFYGLYNVNLQTKEVSLSSGGYYGYIYQGTNLLKIKGKSVIIASRGENYSPNGVIYVDISKGKSEQTKYWHQSIGSKIWSTEDGQYIIGDRGSIYKTPKETTSTQNDLIDLGVLEKKSSSYSYFRWLDHNQATNSFYTISMTGSYYISNESKIQCYDSDSYYLKKTISFEKEYYTTIDNKTDFYTAEPFYIFSNKMGNEIYIIRNVAIESSNYDNYNNWSVETITIQ